MDKKLLGKRINTARKERGWTSERLSEACNINATYLRQIEAENIDFRRSAQPLLDPPYEAHAFGAVQLHEQLDRLIRLAAELFARLLQRKVDIHMAIIVHPAVFHGQAHAVQHEAVQQLRVGGEPSKYGSVIRSLGMRKKAYCSASMPRWYAKIACGISDTSVLPQFFISLNGGLWYSKREH